MTRPLSNHLRRRAAAVVDGVMSRRGAERRFQIAPSTAIGWVRNLAKAACAVERRHSLTDANPAR